jgi:hypothetical protein
MAKAAHLSVVAGTQHDTAEREFTERQHRYSVMLTGRIRRSHATNHMPIKVRNISAGGMMCECGYPARHDEAVEVELPRLGVVAGRIRWTSGSRIGIEFDGPVDPTLAWAKQQKSEVLFELPAMSTRRPGVVSAH